MSELQQKSSTHSLPSTMGATPSRPSHVHNVRWWTNIYSMYGIEGLKYHLKLARQWLFSLQPSIHIDALLIDMLEYQAETFLLKDVHSYVKQASAIERDLLDVPRVLTVKHRRR